MKTFKRIFIMSIFLIIIFGTILVFRNSRFKNIPDIKISLLDKTKKIISKEGNYAFSNKNNSEFSSMGGGTYSGKMYSIKPYKGNFKEKILKSKNWKKFENSNIPIESRSIVSDISRDKYKNLYSEENYWTSKKVEGIDYISIYSDKDDLIYFFEF